MQTPTIARVNSIDLLRGIVMIVMALDHTRDFYGNAPFNPLDVTQTNTAYFFTRWITHYCAPAFVLLAGVSAFLSLQKGKTKKQASFFLLTRGLWLIFMEVAIVSLLWSFDLSYSFTGLQVIWAIGFSMMVLSALVYLNPVWVGLIGLFIIFTHNTLDSFEAEKMGSFKLLWSILHEQKFIRYAPGRVLGVIYPVLPWIGVMASGYWLGSVYLLQAAQRRKILLASGIVALLLFIIIRYTNAYGDMHTWQTEDTTVKTLLSFINCTKYPPSLLYLLMTLGPALIFLGLSERISSSFTQPILVFGKVPFFYYLLHLLFIHGSAVITAKIMGISMGSVFNHNAGWGFDLLTVYFVWLLIVAALYYPCYQYMRYKQKHKYWWLGYL